MSRRAPSILSVASSVDGGIEVTWGIDTFFADSEAPEKVRVDLNGLPFAELDGDEQSVEIPQARIAALGTQILAISITFVWSGDPGEQLQSSVTVPIQAGGGGNTGVLAASRPVVTVVKVQARTRQAASSITIAWKSNNYNDGNIFWGPVDGQPEAFRHSIRPKGDVSHGTFQTDQPLGSALNYMFKVEVRNTLHSPDWISTTVVVRSASDTISLRQFLLGRNLPASSSVHALVGPDRSVRTMILG